jgi:HlyD family secretion protein
MSLDFCSDLHGDDLTKKRRLVLQLNRMKKTGLLILFTILGLLGLTAGSFYWLAAQRSASKTASSEAASVPEQTRVLAIAYLEPAGEIITITGTLGERVARLEVAEGDWVEPGRILAYLSSYAVQQSRRDLAASRVTELTTQLQTDTSAAKEQVAQSAAQMAQIDRPQLLQVQAQQAVLERVAAELTSAVTTRDRYRQLLRDGAIAQQDLDDQELVVQQAQADVHQAQETLEQLRRSRETNLQKAQADLNYAKAALIQVQSHSSIESARQELALAESQLEQTLIRAPQAGKILKIFAHPGESLDKQGLLQLGDTRTMYAVAEIYETDVKFIRIGQFATVHSPVFAQPLRGKVAQIGQFIFKNQLTSDDPAVRADARVVEVKIKLDESESVATLSQLQVDVEIEL